MNSQIDFKIKNEMPTPAIIHCGGISSAEIPIFKLWLGNGGIVLADDSATKP